MNIVPSKYNYYLKTENTLIIYNIRTREYIACSDKEHNLETILESKLTNEFILENNEFITHLVKKDFLIDFQRDETKELLKKRREIINSDEIISLMIAPTMKCNLNCDYCFQDKNKLPKADESIDSTVIDFVKSKKPKFIDVRWFGGEPTLKFDSIVAISEQLIKLADENNIEYKAEMTTNGILIPRISLDQLSKSRIGRFQISVDGYEDIIFGSRKYKNGISAVNEIISGIRYLIDNGCDEVVVRFNISKKNVSDIKRILENFASDMTLKKSVLAFDLLMLYGNIAEDEIYTEEEFSHIQFDLIKTARRIGLRTVDLISRQEKYFHCLAEANYYYAIDPFGDIYKCDFDLTDKNVSIGNISDLSKIKKSSIREIDDVCINCQLLPICWGGCMKSRKCPFFKYNIEDRLRYVLFGNEE